VTATLLHLELILDDGLHVLFLILLLLVHFLLAHDLLLLLLALLLLLLLLLLGFLSSLALLLLSLFLGLALLLFLLDALLFFLLTLFLGCGSLFLFGLLSFLLLAHGLHLGSFLIVGSLILILTFIFFIASDSKDLHNVGRGVNSSGCSSEDLLKEEVSLLGFVAGYDLCGLAVDLLPNDELSQLKQLEKPVDLGILVSDGFTVQLFSLEEAITVASNFESGSEDVVDVAEWGFAEELLRHLGFLDKLFIHLRSFLPIVVFSHYLKYLF